MDVGRREVKYTVKQPPKQFSDLPDSLKILVSMQSADVQQKHQGQEFKALAEEREDLVNKLDMKQRARDVREQILMDKKENFSQAVINFNLFIEDMERKQARANYQYGRLKAERMDLEKRIRDLMAEKANIEEKRIKMKKLNKKYAKVEHFFKRVLELSDENMKTPVHCIDRHATLTLNLSSQMEKYMYLLENLEASRDYLTALKANSAQHMLDLRNHLVKLKHKLYDLCSTYGYQLAVIDAHIQQEQEADALYYSSRMAIHNLHHLLSEFRPFTKRKMQDCQSLGDYMDAIKETIEDYSDIVEHFNRQKARKKLEKFLLKQERKTSVSGSSKQSFESSGVSNATVATQEDAV